MQRIVWTDEEWTQLANRVHKIRGRHPDYHLTKLVDSAQKSLVADKIFDSDRKRNLTAQNLEPLIRKLREVDEVYLNALKELPELKDEVEILKKRPTKEQVLDELSPEEISIYFTEQVFDNLTVSEIVARIKNINKILDNVDAKYLSTYLINRLSKELLIYHEKVNDMQKLLSSIDGTKDKAVRSARIAIIGTMGDQFTRIKGECGNCDLVEIDKLHIDRKLPHFDVLVMLGNHCSHPQREIMKAQAKSNGVPREKVFVVNGIRNAIEKIMSV